MLIERLKKRLDATNPAAIVHEVLFRAVRRMRPLRTVTLADEPPVTVIVATNRPHQLDHAVASFDAQNYGNKTLVIVTNGGDFDSTALDQLASRPDVHVLTTPATQSLGSALNAGVRATRGQVIAKFDDDDAYGAEYLASAVNVMRETGAAVIGKKTYFVYLEGVDRTVKIYPGNEGKRVGRVAGGTIVAHRDAIDSVPFPDKNLGEDVGFVRAVERRGFGVFSAAAAGFLQWRGVSGNTWHIEPEHIVEVSADVGPGSDPDYWH